MHTDKLTILSGRHLDGRWEARSPEYPDLHAFGASQREAIEKLMDAIAKKSDGVGYGSLAN